MHNIRSQKAQEKLPYIRLYVDDLFPAELKKIEYETQSKCILNVIKKEDFLKYFEAKVSAS